MKKIKFLAAAMAVALVLLPLGANTIEASAEEPTTYAVKYVEECNDWRYLADTADFNEELFHRELYYMYQEIQDGDIVVVYNDTADTTPALDLGDTHLSNLTVVRTAGFTIIHSGNIDEFYACQNTTASINAPYIATAYVYDDCVCNLGGNVGTLNFYVDDQINSSVGCSGTVDHLYGYSTSDNHLYYDYYNFKKDTLSIGDGGFQTPEGNFSYTAPAAAPAPAPAAPSTSGSASSGSDYDDVPKTGESSLALWLLFAAALCAGGSYIVGKKAQ